MSNHKDRADALAEEMYAQLDDWSHGIYKNDAEHQVIFNSIRSLITRWLLQHPANAGEEERLEIFLSMKVEDFILKHGDDMTIPPGATLKSVYEIWNKTYPSMTTKHKEKRKYWQEGYIENTLEYWEHEAEIAREKLDEARGEQGRHEEQIDWEKLEKQLRNDFADEHDGGMYWITATANSLIKWFKSHLTGKGE